MIGDELPPKTATLAINCLHLSLNQIDLVEKLVHSRAQDHKAKRLQRCLKLRNAANQNAVDEIRILQIDNKLIMAGSALIRHLIQFDLDNIHLNNFRESNTIVIDPVEILQPELSILFQGSEKDQLASKLCRIMNTTSVHELETSWSESKFHFKVSIH
jgi:hypothetical protein